MQYCRCGACICYNLEPPGSQCRVLTNFKHHASGQLQKPYIAAGHADSPDPVAPWASLTACLLQDWEQALLSKDAELLSMQKRLEELQAWQKKTTEQGLQQQRYNSDLLASKQDELLNAQAAHK